MTIGESIKKIRKEKGLTQKQLGEKCGIDEANIRKYELGKQNPKIETIQKIATALDVTWLALLDNTTPEIKSDLIKTDLKNIIENLTLNVTDIRNKNSADIGIEALEKRGNYISLYDQLNSVGQDRAIEQVELLTKVPEYRKADNVAPIMSNNDMPYANMLDAGNETYASEQGIPELEPRTYNEQKKEGSWFKEPHD